MHDLLNTRIVTMTNLKISRAELIYLVVPQRPTESKWF